MLITLASLIVLQSTIPGAKEVVPVVNDRLTTLPLFAFYQPLVPQNGLLSEDGETALVYDGRINRVPLMRRGGKVGGEALGFGLRGTTPYSLTTSQAAHIEEKSGSGIKRVGNMRLLFSSAGSQLLTATNLENNTIRLTVVNLDVRGSRPNLDFRVPNIDKDEGEAVAARMTSGKPAWFVTHVGEDSPTLIYRFIQDGTSLSRDVVGKAPMGLRLLSFDPKAKIAITDQGRRHEFWVVNTDAAAGARINPNVQGYPFISRGEVFFANDDRIYKLNESNKLEVFCEYRLLATSASGNYWVVLDKNEKAWRVNF